MAYDRVGVMFWRGLGLDQTPANGIFDAKEQLHARLPKLDRISAATSDLCLSKRLGSLQILGGIIIAKKYGMYSQKIQDQVSYPAAGAGI